ncbi:hypothetical protein ACRE_036110 [Hapsidospora chrysogenum ATCC 11550]|uniref:Uncharacterized protein n=1 Tax=Hapsidospora chrysogenum (strain ATCC 11550 / CBS 779.69 / DSM 880 / IAM 14645 / JCM 23072 / IMI 49137) TaxID=857340 RepID=A0A086T882_HAPC1|nr:hypothetical protein ACRE_036110 [Hapsidospora chrysogenum ATCC 11550]
MRNIDVARSMDRLQNGVFTWPSQQHETKELLCKVLRPVRQLQGYADERFVIFAAEPETTQPQRRDISIIAFDPSFGIETVESSTNKS